MFKRFRTLAQVFSPLVIIAFATQIVAAELPPNGRTRGDRPDATDSDRQIVRELSQLTNSSGAVVTVSELQGKGRRDGIRIAVDDDVVSEKIDVDSSRNEIRAFGLTFRVTRDAAGTPQLTIAGNGDADSLTGEDRAAHARLNRFFNATNGPARARHVLEVLRSLQKQVSPMQVGAQGWFGCTMDIIALVADWVGVVLGCGAPVIDLFTCGFAIIWATADTINITQNIAGDCGLN